MKQDNTPQEIMTLLLKSIKASLEDEDGVLPQDKAIALQMVKYLNIRPLASETDDVMELRNKIEEAREQRRKLRLVKEDAEELQAASGMV